MRSIKTVPMIITASITLAASNLLCRGTQAQKPSQPGQSLPGKPRQGPLRRGATQQGTPASPGVVSHKVEPGENKPLTRENMLIAEPMPMTGEERQFLFSHKSLQKIQEWTSADFEQYVESPLGRGHVIETGHRWFSLRRMLRNQIAFAKDFLSGKTGGALADQEEGSAGSLDTGSPGSLETTPPGSTRTGLSGSSTSGSPGYSPDSLPRGQRSKHRPKSKDADDADFLKDESSFNMKANTKDIFNKLRACRQDISELCRELDNLVEQARGKGQACDLERAMSSIGVD